MRKAITILGLVLAQVFSYAAEQAVFQNEGMFQAHRYRWVIFERDLASVPKWKDSDESPPLSPRAAVRAASKQFLTFLSREDKAKGCESKSICLRRAGTSENWIYLVTMRVVATQRMGSGMVESLEIPVLMSGKAIGPIPD